MQQVISSQHLQAMVERWVTPNSSSTWIEAGASKPLPAASACSDSEAKPRAIVTTTPMASSFESILLFLRDRKTATGLLAYLNLCKNCSSSFQQGRRAGWNQSGLPNQTVGST